MQIDNFEQNYEQSKIACNVIRFLTIKILFGIML